MSYYIVHSPLRKKTKKKKQPQGPSKTSAPQVTSKKAAAKQSTKPAPSKKPAAAAASAPPVPTKNLPPLQYKGYVGGHINVGTCEHMKPVVYGKLNSMLSMFQKAPGAKDTRILRFADPDNSPICNPSQMPKTTSKSNSTTISQSRRRHGSDVQSRQVKPENWNFPSSWLRMYQLNCW
jgi:hypothetical protein